MLRSPGWYVIRKTVRSNVLLQVRLATFDNRCFCEQFRWESGFLIYDTEKDTVSVPTINFLSDKEKRQFFAHGLSVLRTDEGLFVYSVNHGKDGDSIYVFSVNVEKKTLYEYQPRSALMIETNHCLFRTQTHNMRHQLMYSMNDLVAVGGGIVYATNDLRQQHGSKFLMVEGFLRLPITFSIGCNIETGECFKAAEHIRVRKRNHFPQTNKLNYDCCVWRSWYSRVQP